MSISPGDAAFLGGTIVFALSAMRVLEKMIDKASVARNGKKSEPPPPQPIVTGQHAALEPDCRDRIVETHVLVAKLVEAESKQTDLLTAIDKNTGRMVDLLERRA